MSTVRQIEFTPAGLKRVDEMFDKIRSNIESEFIERKYVPGDQAIEVTGSDVDDLESSMRISFIDRDRRRSFMRDLIVRMYFVLGILTLTVGLLYPYLQILVYNPVQLALVGTGLMMSLGSYAIYGIQKRREMMHKDRRIAERPHITID